MSPPLSHPSLHLQVLPESFFVVQVQLAEDIPPCVLKDLTGGTSGFFSVTRTNDEISLVGESHEGLPDNLKQRSDWRCIKILGPMEHDLTGIMANFTAPLKAAKVPIFALSTWNTDYVLVPTKMLSDAIIALEKDGWVFVQGARNRTSRL